MRRRSPASETKAGTCDGKMKDGTDICLAGRGVSLEDCQILSGVFLCLNMDTYCFSAHEVRETGDESLLSKVE